MVLYGQVVVGPPGSGKTTYCNGMQQYLRCIGRETLVINLDPANESFEVVTTGGKEEETCATGHHLQYDTLLDVSEEIINLSSVMTKLHLGPNGGLVYCMEYIEHHLDPILRLLSQRLHDRNVYLLFDFPGQVELYTHNTCVQNILSKLVKELDLRLCAVHLVDAYYCRDATKFISAALLSITCMLRLELPAVNVLSKVDLLATTGEDLSFNLDFFTSCHDLNRLVSFLYNTSPLSNNNNNEEEDNSAEIYNQTILDDPEYKSARIRTQQTTFHRRNRKLHESLCEVIEDFSLLSYIPLNVTDAESMGRLVARIDKCNGYIFLANTKSGVNDMLFRCAITQVDKESDYEHIISNVQERFLGNMFQEHIPELDRQTTDKKE